MGIVRQGEVRRADVSNWPTHLDDCTMVRVVWVSGANSYPGHVSPTVGDMVRVYSTTGSRSQYGIWLGFYDRFGDAVDATNDEFNSQFFFTSFRQSEEGDQRLIGNRWWSLFTAPNSWCHPVGASPDPEPADAIRLADDQLSLIHI